LIPLLSELRPLSKLRRHANLTTAWWLWLGVALLVAAALSPGTVTASRLVFQSPPEATPIPPTATPPPPTATAVPPPPTSTPAPPPAVSTPVEVVPTEAPTEALPPEAAPPHEPPPTEETPAEPSMEPTEPPTAVPEPTTPVEADEAPDTPLPPEVGTNQPIINWVKFWDTMAVTFAYPWLCCGVTLLLMVPVVLLFLEIKGRRRPPIPPEELPLEEEW
jgi:hypothetical protein